MSRVIHFEIHATEPPRLIEFYTGLFGWTFQKWDGAEYWIITTGAAGEAGIDGGLVLRRGPAPAADAPVSAFACTVQVDSLDDTLASATGLGATPALPKMAIPGIGWLAYIKDPDGNLLGLMQPDPSAA